MELFVFLVAAAIILGGAVGVIAFRNPVHSALSLVATLFGVAVLFVAKEAHFLAAVQVIVYAGAIVVLFLFVIMLLGVDEVEDLRTEPLVGQRPAAALVALATFGILVAAILTAGGAVTGASAAGTPRELGEGFEDVTSLARSLFTDYLFAFEVTSALLVIAVIGAVILARRPAASGIDGSSSGASRPAAGEQDR